MNAKAEPTAAMAEGDTAGRVAAARLRENKASVKKFRPLCDLLVMTGSTAGRWAVASAGAAALHVLAWPYTAAVLAATAVYRLLAEGARRKTLVDLVSHTPTGTIVAMEKGPEGPARRVRVGDGLGFPPCAEVWRGG